MLASASFKEVELTKFQRFMDKLVNAWTSLHYFKQPTWVMRKTPKFNDTIFVLGKKIKNGEISGDEPLKSKHDFGISIYF